jgi:hypothetical protein
MDNFTTSVSDYTIVRRFKGPIDYESIRDANQPSPVGFLESGEYKTTLCVFSKGNVLQYLNVTTFYKVNIRNL